MRAIPEHLRGVFMTKRDTNPRLPLPYLTTAQFPDYFQIPSFPGLPATVSQLGASEASGRGTHR